MQTLPRKLAVVGVATLMLVLSAVAPASALGPNRSQSNSRSKAHGGAGVLTGKILLAGGDPLAHVHVVVTVFGSHHKAVAHSRSSTGHRFRFELPPGQYELILKPRYSCRPVTIRVHANRLARVNIATGCSLF